MIELGGGERIAVLKTHFLRLIQRTWKRIFGQRGEQAARPRLAGMMSAYRRPETLHH